MTVDIKRKLKVLELCGGLESWLKPFAEAGHECTSVDIKDYGNHYGRFIKADLLDWEPDQEYDLVLASPPCSEFSEVKRNTAQRYSERRGLHLVYRVLYLIDKIKPKYWVMENVWGLSEFIDKPKDIVRYRRAKNGKRAYLWGNFPSLGFFDMDINYKSEFWHFRDGWNEDNRAQRAIIPEALTRQMFKVMTITE